ncbi:MAG TPA: DsbA family protein, partial [Steroidobacteraceae bacterium]
MQRHTIVSFIIILGVLASTIRLGAEDLGSIPKSAEIAILRNPGTPAVGAKDADVILVEYFDYNCPFCKKLAPGLQALLKSDPKVALVYKDWPILSEVSKYAARSALAAGWQDKYLIAHDALMGASHLASGGQIDALLRGAGLDVDKLMKDRDAHSVEIKALLRRNDSEARALGIRGTPGLLVGPHIINGVYDVPGLQQAVAAARREPSAATAATAGTDAARHDTIIRQGLIYDGSGKPPFAGDVVIDGDRITYVGPRAQGVGRTEINAHGKAVAPGFINMLAHPEESLLVDGRALSDLRQGVTLEVMGEVSMGPLNPAMKAEMVREQGDIHFDVDWTTLGEYLEKLQKKGIAPNVASFVSAGTVRTNILGQDNVQPTPAQLLQMRGLVRQAMEEGAVGVTTALIYNPFTYAKTPELIELADESARCGGMYIAHMRSEGDRLVEAVQETIDIAKASGAPAEIYHLKVGGKVNWGKLDTIIEQIHAARAAGIRITAD